MAKEKIRKPSGLKSDGTPNVHWKRFKNRLIEYSNKPVSSWTSEEILGHILKRYREFSGNEFTLSYSGAPTKCSEIYCTNRMIHALGSENNAEVSKEYIDWVFDTVIIPQNISINSIAFFFTSNLIQKFKAEARKRRKLTRATQLPAYIEEVTKTLDINYIWRF
ncbi:MAG: hypothetical protein HC877_23775 [Thioploca sp.]|nr:hypothetical protein [Thioploca sp.]